METQGRLSIKSKHRVLGTMAQKLRLCVLTRAALYRSSTLQTELAGELSLNFPNLSNLLRWWFWTLSPSVRRRKGTLYSDRNYPLPQLLHGSGCRIFLGSLSALETRKKPWEWHGCRGKYPAASSMAHAHSQVCWLSVPWLACGFCPRHIASTGRTSCKDLSPQNSQGTRCWPQTIWAVRKHHLPPQPQTLYFSLE